MKPLALAFAAIIVLTAAARLGVGRGEEPRPSQERQTWRRASGLGLYPSAWISETPIAPGPAYTPRDGPKRAM